MDYRKIAYDHLQTLGNFVENKETGKRVERGDMCGGKYLAFDETGNVAGFKDFNECMDYVGIS